MVPQEKELPDELKILKISRSPVAAAIRRCGTSLGTSNQRPSGHPPNMTPRPLAQSSSEKQQDFRLGTGIIDGNQRFCESSDGAKDIA